MFEKKERKTIESFIFESVQSGYNCILIGEHHGGQQGLPALDNIAPQLQSYAIKHGVQFVIFNETNDVAADETIAKPNEPKNITENLQMHGILTYGLENEKSSRDKVIYGSLDDAFKFLSEHNLLKSFIDTTYSMQAPGQIVPEDLEGAFQKIHLEFFQGDQVRLQQTIQSYYGGSDYRIMWANEAWCNYIEQMPDNIVCLVTVGSAHIPSATRKDTMISGMQELLSQKRKTISTFIVKSNDQLTFAPYIIKDNHLKYHAIENVSCSEIYLESIFKKIDNKISILSKKSGWSDYIKPLISSTNIKKSISALENLKSHINETAELNPQMHFGDLIDDFLNNNKNLDNPAKDFIKFLREEYNSYKIIDFNNSYQLKNNFDYSYYLANKNAIILKILKKINDINDNEKTLNDLINKISLNQVIEPEINNLKENFGDKLLLELKNDQEFKLYLESIEDKYNKNYAGYMLAKIYRDLLFNENNLIKHINQELSVNMNDNNYLAYQDALNKKIIYLEKLFEDITELRHEQCEIISNIFEKKILTEFLEALFLSKKSLVENIKKFITQYLSYENPEDALASQSYTRYINALINRYINGINDDSFEELLQLLDKGKQKILVEYGIVSTEIDPIDSDGNTCYEFCAKQFQYDQEILDKNYNDSPQKFHNSSLIIYDGKPNADANKIKNLRIRLQDSNLHNIVLGIEEGKVRFYYQPEFMTIFHEELHALRILQGETGPEESENTKDLPMPLKNIYHSLEEYFNISIGRFNESHYCIQASLPKRIGHHAIILGKLPENTSNADKELSKIYYKLETWKEYYKQTNHVYKGIHIVEHIFGSIDKCIKIIIGKYSKEKNEQIKSLISKDLYAMMSLKYEISNSEGKTLNDIVEKWKKKFEVKDYFLDLYKKAIEPSITRLIKKNKDLRLDSSKPESIKNFNQDLNQNHKKNIKKLTPLTEKDIMIIKNLYFLSEHQDEFKDQEDNIKDKIWKDKDGNEYFLDSNGEMWDAQMTWMWSKENSRVYKMNNYTGEEYDFNSIYISQPVSLIQQNKEITKQPTSEQIKIIKKLNYLYENKEEFTRLEGDDDNKGVWKDSDNNQYFLGKNEYIWTDINNCCYSYSKDETIRIIDSEGSTWEYNPQQQVFIFKELLENDIETGQLTADENKKNYSGEYNDHRFFRQEAKQKTSQPNSYSKEGSQGTYISEEDPTTVAPLNKQDSEQVIDESREDGGLENQYRLNF